MKNTKFKDFWKRYDAIIMTFILIAVYVVLIYVKTDYNSLFSIVDACAHIISGMVSFGVFAFVMLGISLFRLKKKIHIFFTALLVYLCILFLISGSYYVVLTNFVERVVEYVNDGGEVYLDDKLVDFRTLMSEQIIMISYLNKTGFYVRKL